MNMKTIARVLLGLPMLVFGLNGFLHFMPMPPMPAAAQQFLMGLGGSGYFFPLLKITEIVCGALLLANLYVPLALVVLAPVLLNILLFHVFLDPGQGIILPVVMVVLELYLAREYWDSFSGILESRSE